MNNVITIIMPNFYYFEDSIKNDLLNLGFEPHFFIEDRLSLRYRFLNNLNFTSQYVRSFQKKYFEFLESNKPKVLLIIKGDFIDCEFIEKVRRLSPQTKIVMYQWDSIERSDYSSWFRLVDEAWTFDPQDSKNLKIGYLPLFYTSHYGDLANQLSSEESALFIGSAHGDRLNIIKQLKPLLRENGIKLDSYIYMPFLMYIKKLFLFRESLLNIKYYKFKPLSLDDVVNLYKNVKYIVDIESPDQRGLTIRTMEALGSGRKLITTNENIFKESFYSSNFIYVYSRGSNEFSPKANFLKPHNYNFSSYSSAVWILNLLGVDGKL